MKSDQPLRHVAILGSRGFPSTYSGYETLVRHLARDWAAQGIAVTVFCRERPSRVRSWTVEGVRCRWTPGVNSKSFSTLSFGLTGALSAATLPIDAALVLNLANGFYLPLLRTRGIGTVVNTDGIEWERGKWGSFAQRIFLAGAHATAKCADVIVADSVEIGRIWKDKFGVDSRFIPYGAETPSAPGSELVEGLGLRPGGYALVVARVTPENNPELILDAAATRPGLPLVFVGSANYDSPIEDRLRELDRSDRITWLGHVADQELLSQLWAHCGVYVHGHSVGGTNPSLLQALGLGAPTLAIDTPFNREVIDHDEQLFPPDAEILGGRIAEVMAEGEVRQRWKELGRKTVRERYRWDDVSASYLDALSTARDIRAKA